MRRASLPRAAPARATGTCASRARRRRADDGDSQHDARLLACADHASATSFDVAAAQVPGAAIPPGPPPCLLYRPEGVTFREPTRRGAFILVKRRSEAGIPRTNWLLAAAVLLLLLVPPSAVSYPPGLTATEISSAKVCGAGECREVSDPEAATALAVGARPRGTDAPVRGLPWYKSTLTIRAEDGGDVFTDRISATVVPSAGLMRAEDGFTWVTLPSESKEAYTKLTAGLTPRPARTLPSVGEDALPVARVDEVFCPACAATPASAS